MRSPFFLIDRLGAGRKAGARARARFAVLLLLCLFAQWTISIGVIIDSGDSRCCPPSGCVQLSVQRHCTLTPLPEEAPVFVPSIFYRAAILPMAVLPVLEAIDRPFRMLPSRFNSVPRSRPRRPPR